MHAGGHTHYSRPEQMCLQGVIFDLDGTLVDSREADLRALSQALVETQGQVLSWEALSSFFGLSSRQTAEQLAGENAEQLLACWSSIYRQEKVKGIRIFPGVEAVLRDLQASGLLLGVVTLQTRSELSLTRQHVSLDHWIDEWVALDDTTQPKPHPEPIWLVLKQLGLDPGHCVMVGDSIKDMRAGRAAGLQVAAALWGSLEVDELIAFQPDFIYCRPEKMRQLCEMSKKC